ncbi:MAG TPA: TRAP transporter large permease [Candidatus Dormibacteraeota bacterium]
MLIMGEVPVALAMLLAAAVYFLFLGPGIPATIIAQQVIGLPMESFPLLAVPLFLLAGNLLNESGMTARLVAFALAAIGFIRGGMGHAVVVANVIMAGMTGSATADAAGIGSMMIPVLKRSGFGAAHAAALSACAATIGPIVPPSIAMVIYSSVSGTSLGQLLLGGIVPGLVMALFLMVNLFLSPEAKRLPRQPLSIRKILAGGRDAILSLIMPLIILGGMFTGVYTPTEGAAVAVAYAAFIGLVVYRTLTPRSIYRALVESATTSGIVLVIVAAASAISWIMTEEHADQVFGSLFTVFHGSPHLTILAIIFFVVLLGMIMEDTAIIVLMTPILAPIAIRAGVDPVHFGVTFILATVIGLTHPPAGITMFITASIAKVTVWDFIKVAWRPILTLLAACVVVSQIPQLVLFIPSHVIHVHT